MVSVGLCMRDGQVSIRSVPAVCSGDGDGEVNMYSAQRRGSIKEKKVD